MFDESGNFLHYNGNFNALGKLTDETGLKYNYKYRDHSIIHDDLPHTFQLKGRVISQGGGDNFEVDILIHINEQSEPTKMDLGGEECKG